MMVSQEEEEEDALACCERGSWVYMACFDPICEYFTWVTFGGEGELKEDAYRMVAARMRRHITSTFHSEHTRRKKGNFLTDATQGTWDALKDGTESMHAHEFEQWDHNTLAKECAHHPVNARAAVDGKLWTARIHQIKADDPDKQQLEVCVTSCPPIDMDFSWSGHWPAEYREKHRAEMREATLKMRRSVHFDIARAAVKSYKRFKKRHGPKPMAGAPMVGDALGEDNWLTTCRKHTLLSMGVACIESDKPKTTPCSATKAELQAILDSVGLGTGGTGAGVITVQDIITLSSTTPQ